MPNHLVLEMLQAIYTSQKTFGTVLEVFSRLNKAIYRRGNVHTPVEMIKTFVNELDPTIWSVGFHLRESNRNVIYFDISSLHSTIETQYALICIPPVQSEQHIAARTEHYALSQ